MIAFFSAGVKYFLDDFFLGAPGPLGPHDAVDEVGREFDVAVVDAARRFEGVCLGVDAGVEAGVVRGPLDADAVVRVGDVVLDVEVAGGGEGRLPRAR